VDEHTTPTWHVTESRCESGVFLVRDHDHKTLIAFSGRGSADFVCRKLNHHDKLKAAAKTLVDDFGEALKTWDNHRYLLVEDLRAALADMEKEQPNVIERLKQKVAEQAGGKETP